MLSKILSFFGREKPIRPPKARYEVSFEGPYLHGLKYDNEKYIRVNDLIDCLKMLREKDPEFDKGYKCVQVELERYRDQVNSEE